MIGAILRIYSYLYTVALALLLLGIGVVAAATSTHLKLEMLPWQHSALTYWVLLTGLVGLVSVALALAGKLRFLFLLYALAVFGLMFRGYFLTGYTFRGKDEFRFAIWLTVGALLAIFGAWSQFRKKKASKRR